MRPPAVPVHEHEVRAEVEAICAEHGLEAKRDKFGNVIVRLVTAPKARPFSGTPQRRHNEARSAP